MMKVLVAFVALTCVYAHESEMSSELKEHYQLLGTKLIRQQHLMSSPYLAEITTNLAVENPIQTIHDTVMVMKTEIQTEVQKANRKFKKDEATCNQNKKHYSERRAVHSRLESEASAKKTEHFEKKEAQKSQPPAYNVSMANYNASCTGAWDQIVILQKQRDVSHQKFLKSQKAFYDALSQILIIRRALNGEGQLSDLAGTEFLEGTTCSSHMTRMSKDFSHVSVLSSMLQTFSKAFSRLESSDPTKDMDAINVILDKVKENLVNSMTLAAEQEAVAVNLWKQSKIQKINEMSVICQLACKAGRGIASSTVKLGIHYIAYAEQAIIEAENEYLDDRYTFLFEWEEKSCNAMKAAHELAIRSLGNEKDALQNVLTYMKSHMYDPADSSVGYSKTLSDVISSPYRWAPETNPVYVKVSNTYSTISGTPGGFDPLTCRKGFATVFSQIRILTQTKTNNLFINPNDLEHSKNMDVDRQTDMADSDMNCQLYPTGIPVGRASACNPTAVKGVIDLTGTPYKFQSQEWATKFFVKAGRRSQGNAKLSPDNKKLVLTVTGFCGDIYGDDSPGEFRDYRSDPIPIVLG
jgi:hypothetical protein